MPLNTADAVAVRMVGKQVFNLRRMVDGGSMKTQDKILLS